MAKRKYFTEFAINMLGTGALLQQDVLENPEAMQSMPRDMSYHIYMIARRPRIAWDIQSLKFTKDRFSGVFTIQRGHDLERHEFEEVHHLGTDQIKIICPYPHTEYRFEDQDGQCVHRGKVALAMANVSSKHWTHMDLEVLYVGQSYGVNGSRVAPDRLKSHSTLQGIYGEASRRSPDKEVWLILWDFTPLLITSWDGRSKEFQTTTDEDNDHAEKVRNFEITTQQQINFTEAALIRYFNPEYNKLLKDSFPNPAHKTYSQCYELDINTVNVEIPCEPIRARLWSHAVPPLWTHFAKYELHSTEERKSMFDFN